MTCRESQLVAFLAGDLDVEESRRFDAHLLDCEECWRGVQEDRYGRRVAESLRTTAPAGLGDRIRIAVHLTELQPSGIRRRIRPHRALAAAAVLIVALAVGAAVGVGLRDTTPRGSAQVAAVMALAEPNAAASMARTHEDRHLFVDGQMIDVHAVHIHGVMAVVAESARPFSAPQWAHSDRSANTWMATRGRMGLYSVNNVRGHSMLVVAPMPAVELPQVAAELNLI